MISKVYLMSVVLCLLVGEVKILAQQDANEIFKKSKSLLLTSASEMLLDIKSTDKKGRVKEKTMRIWQAKLDGKDKTKVSWLKPERAKGTTVILTDPRAKDGVIEVYTPSNGKKRKMKASGANMKMIGSDFYFLNFDLVNSDKLNYNLIKEEDLEGHGCYLLEVISEGAKGESKGELWISKANHHLLQVKVYNEVGSVTRIIKLRDYQAVPSSNGKAQAMHIISEDLKNGKRTEVSIKEVISHKGLQEADFQLGN